MTTTAPGKTIEIYCSYTREDVELFDALEKHLRVMKTEGLINEWDDRQSIAGIDLAEERLRNLNKAQIILLCASSDYMASEECRSEMRQALQRHTSEGTVVIPVLLRPFFWQVTSLATLSMLPSTATPVTMWENRDDALVDVVKGVHNVISRWSTVIDVVQPLPPQSKTIEPTSGIKVSSEHSVLIQRSQSRPLSLETTGTLPGQTATTDRSVQLYGNQNRQLMLGRVYSFWIKGVLENTLHGAALMKVGLQEQVEAVENPMRLVLQNPDQLARLLPSGTPITELYDAAGGELLILGLPGSGKTTLLLDLTRDLLERARRDEGHPIPVVFNLSSWSTRRQAITDWLVEELNTKYQVPRKVGQRWVDADQVLPLLDGLDEVALEFRPECVEAINKFRQEHGFVPVVVCSRIADYLELPARIDLQSAVVLQPLTKEQIDDYLASMSEQTSAMREVIQKDSALEEMATNPLMLNLLTLAYAGKPVEGLSTTGSFELQREQVFKAYVQRMLRRQRTRMQYTQEQTVGWLSWLAKQLVKHKQTQFYIERMQMDWLPDNWLRRLSLSLAIGLVYGLSFGLVYALFFSFFYGMTVSSFQTVGLQLGFASQTAGVRSGLLIGLFNALLYILLNGLVFGLLGAKETTVQPAAVVMRRSEKVRRKLINFLGNRVVYSLLAGLLNGVFITWLIIQDVGSDNLWFSLIQGPICALINGVVYGVLGKLEAEIQPAEVLSWSWKRFRRNLIKMVPLGLLLGIVIAFFDESFFNSVSVQQVFSNITSFITYFFPSLFSGSRSLLGDLLIGLVVGLLLGLAAGLSNEKLDERRHIAPNEGMRRSARNSLRLGLAFGLAWGVVAYATYDYLWGSGALQYKLEYTIAIGLAIGIVFALRYGGVACIQHLLLRIQLWRANAIPWYYARFLDYAAERVLLRKVGGGYIFIHRSLLEYFASLDSTDSALL